MANLNLNKIILGGRLTADPELRKTESDLSVTSFTIAVNRRNKDGTTDFINCTAWRGTAEFITKYFHKGSSICIVGSLTMRKWVDNDGNNRTSPDVVVDEALFVDSANESKKTNNIVDDDDLPFEV